MANRTNHPTMEKTDPDRAADAGALLADPLLRLKDAMVGAGVNPHFIRKFLQRLGGKSGEIFSHAEEITTKKLLRLLDEKALMALESMDEMSFLEAPLRDKAVALGIILEKRQLLSGEPTAILSVEERRHLDELIPMLMAEAQRRGHVIDVTPDNDTRLIPTQSTIDNTINKTPRNMQRLARKYRREF